MSRPIGVGPRRANWVTKGLSSDSDERLTRSLNVGRCNLGSWVDEAVRRKRFSHGDVCARTHREAVLIAFIKVYIHYLNDLYTSAPTDGDRVIR